MLTTQSERSLSRNKNENGCLSCSYHLISGLSRLFTLIESAEERGKRMVLAFTYSRTQSVFDES